MTKITWRCPSNIALIKYWGKRGIQLPMNPSLSFSLSESFTETTVEFIERKSNRTEFTFEFFLDGEKMDSFEEKLEQFFVMIRSLIPGLHGYHLKIDSHNSFPHSTGIASSASAFSALALCLCTAEEQLYGRTSGFSNYLEKASYIARLGSGSAARSVYGGFVSWGNTVLFNQSSDEWAMPLPIPIALVFMELQNTILIVSSQTKKISSSKGHEYMETNPYAGIHYKQSVLNYRELAEVLTTGDVQTFIRVTEEEALGLHAMFLTSQPGFFLFQPATIKIIERIRQFRNDTGLFICFTLDAGPNIHVIYSHKDSQQIQDFINQDLLPLCENQKCIYDQIGGGPELISK